MNKSNKVFVPTNALTLRLIVIMGHSYSNRIDTNIHIIDQSRNR